MSTENDDDDRSVGYKKPPKHSQFQKGTSGNPKGRPKRIDDYILAVAEVLKQHVRINENGVVKDVPKFAAILRRLANRAASGDAEALAILGWWWRTKKLDQYEESEEDVIFIIKEQPLGRPEGTYEAVKVERQRWKKR